MKVKHFIKERYMFMSVTDKIKTMIFKIYMINNIFKFTKSPGRYLMDTVS